MSSQVDFIKQLLQKVNNGQDTVISIYHVLWMKLPAMNYKETTDILNLLYPIAQNNTDTKALHLLAEGMMYLFASKYKEAIDKMGDAEELFASINNTEGQGAINTMRVVCYRSLGQMDKAQSNLQAALKNLEHTDSESLFGNFRLIAYYQAGELCTEVKNYDSARENILKGLAYEKSNIMLRIRLLNSLASLDILTDNWEEALGYFNQSLALLENRKNPSIESKVYTDIGNYYALKGELNKALEYQEKSLKLRLDNGIHAGAVTNYIQLAELFFKQKNSEQALMYGKLAVEKAVELNLIPKLFEAHRILSSIYESTGDINVAFEHYKKYTAYKDEVHNTDVATRIAQINSRYEIEFMQQQKETAELQRKLVEEHQKEIIDSITYARRIQRALITNEYYIDKSLKKLMKG